VKRIALCAAGAERLSERAPNSVDLSKNTHRCLPADASLGSMVKLILVLLAKTPPQFAVGRDKCSTSGAKYRFVVVQYARITESKTSASWATEFCSLVEAGSNLLMEIYVLVYRHGALDSVGLESITVPTDGSLIAYFRCKQASVGESIGPVSSSYSEAGACFACPASGGSSF
jgi:hypothetical protein